MCDQTAKLFLNNMAISNNENLLINIKYFHKTGLKFSKY